MRTFVTALALLVPVVAAAADPATGAATATYVGTDATTQGNWSRSFGGDGFMLPDGTAKNPAYAHVVSTGAEVYTWAASSAEPRCPTINAESSDRVANCWYGALMSFDIACADANPHLVTVYAFDWDRLSRTEHIEIIDGSGAVLNAQDLSGFGDGVFATWWVSGHVTIKVTNTGPQNAVISGVFFGAGTAVNGASATGAAAVPATGAAVNR